VQGYNGTILCYGQTGAGKTFTMTGSSTEYKYRGIVPRAVAQVYHEIADRFDQAITIRISYVEIYNEMVRITGSEGDLCCYRCLTCCLRFPLMNSRRRQSK
jgi:Cdc6-like AAA superfamily ATPase